MTHFGEMHDAYDDGAGGDVGGGCGDECGTYEVIGGAGAADATITDFEGRAVVRGVNSLKITGESAAHMIVRWRFDKVKNVTVDGSAVKVQTRPDGEFVEFDHMKERAVAWQ
jgi:alpha-D-xyloside xylohydrolase